MLHDYSDEEHWSENENFDLYAEGDVVLAQDPQKRLGDPTYSVCEILSESAIDRVKQRGLFWSEEKARAFAEQLHGDRQKIGKRALKISGRQEALAVNCPNCDSRQYLKLIIKEGICLKCGCDLEVSIRSESK